LNIIRGLIERNLKNQSKLTKYKGTKITKTDLKKKRIKIETGKRFNFEFHIKKIRKKAKNNVVLAMRDNHSSTL
jgi:hypothetical protein